MSYILDALRKSEQQRQAIQPENLTERILLNQANRESKRFPWLLSLVLINLILLIGAGWFYFQSTESTKSVTASGAVSADKAIEHPIRIIPIPPQTFQLQTPNAEQTVSSSGSSTIEEMVAASNQASSSTPRITKVEKKTAEAMRLNGKQQATTLTKRIKTVGGNLEQAPQARLKKGILRVDELSPVIRNNLPKLNINVFSYAYAPNERFVIINMVKYHIGQRIDGTVTLKNIFPDYIVLEYENTQFSIERP